MINEFIDPVDVSVVLTYTYRHSFGRGEHPVALAANINRWLTREGVRDLFDLGPNYRLDDARVEAACKKLDDWGDGRATYYPMTETRGLPRVRITRKGENFFREYYL